MNPGAVVLAISMAANAALGWAWLDACDAATAAIGERDRARADATACSGATENLRDLAYQRKREADIARDTARRDAAGHHLRADAILTKGPTVPGDDCRSATERAEAWLASRRAP